MPAGFQVWNNGLQIQIDSDFRNLHLMQNVNVVCNQTNGYIYWADVTFGDLNIPVIALYTFGGFAFAVQQSRSGSVGTYRIYATSLNQTIKVLIFDTAATPSSNYGLQVFDGSGNLVFDSGRSYMRVIDSISGIGSPAENPVPQSRNYPGKTVAIAAAIRQSRFVAENTSPGLPDQTLFWISSTTYANADTIQINATTTNVVGPVVGGGSTASEQRLYNYLVLDVTNMI